MEHCLRPANTPIIGNTYFSWPDSYIKLSARSEGTKRLWDSLQLPDLKKSRAILWYIFPNLVISIKQILKMRYERLERGHTMVQVGNKIKRTVWNLVIVFVIEETHAWSRPAHTIWQSKMIDLLHPILNLDHCNILIVMTDVSLVAGDVFRHARTSWTVWTGTSAWPTPRPTPTTE